MGRVRARFMVTLAVALVIGVGCGTSGAGSDDVIPASDAGADAGSDATASPDADVGGSLDSGPDTIVPECGSPADCADESGPLPPCMYVDCVNGHCVVDTDPDGTPCISEDGCAARTRCLGGECQPSVWDGCAGACGPARDIYCFAEVEGETGAGGATHDGWPCGDYVELFGPEHVLRFQAPYLLDGTVALVTEADDLQLLVVEGDGDGGCAPAGCVSAHPLGGTFHAEPGDTFFFIVDGTASAGAAYKVGLGCSSPAIERACGDGLDNDQDGATDCDDADDCVADPHCDGTAGTCEANYLVACGHTETWSTGSVLALNTNENYVCDPGDFSGPEYIYSFRSPEAQRAHVTLGDPDPWEPTPHQWVLILEGVCEPTTCVAAGEGEVSFDVAPDTDYYVVVDALMGFEGFFNIRIDCEPAAEAGDE